MKEIITIQNLKCGGCANTIIKKITALKGISEVEVDTATNSVSFNAATKEAIETVTEQLKVLGYPSTDDANSLVSKAKSFISCATGRVNS